VKFVVLTDTHFVPRGQMLYGLDPAQRLSKAIETINRDHADIDFVIVTGDLAHNGEPAAYDHLKSVLAKLRAPAFLMLGNHDRRGAFDAAFSGVGVGEDGFVHWIREFSEGTIIALDTLDEDGGAHAGRLCAPRLTFLERALTNAPSHKAVLLFQHHPPFDTGLPHMDSIKLDRADEEWEVMRRTRLPDYLFVGHVHRPINGVWRGVPFQIQRALNHHVGFDLLEETFIPGSHEQPDYSLVSVKNRDIVVLQRSFLYDGPSFSLDDKAAARAQSSEELRCSPY
jgi:3',5'-cyclic AMP phosphodiesterase CpdA